MAIDPSGCALHGLADGDVNRIRAEPEVAVAATLDAAAAAGSSRNIVDARGDDEGDFFIPAFGAGEFSAAFLDVGGDDVALRIGFVFGDEHGHVNHGGSLRAKMNGKVVLAGAIGVVEGDEHVLRRAGWV